MAKPRDAFQNKLKEQGLCDERGVGFCATAKPLPNGEYGIVLLALRGETLYLYDILDIKNTVGDLLYEIPLTQIQEIKTAASFLGEMTHGYSLRFQAGGYTYSFSNCFPMKDMIQTIVDAAAACSAS